MATATVVAALAIGLPAALFVFWPFLRRTPEGSGTPADDLRATLEAEKTLALRAIRELAFDHQAGHLTDEDYADLRARDEARAAAILKRLDELGPEPAPAPASPAHAPAAAAAPTPWARRPLVLVGAAVALVAFGVLLGVLVVRFTQPEPPSGPPGPMAEMAVPGPAEAPEPGGAAAGSPESGSPRPIPKETMEGMLRAAHTALDQGRYQEAIAAYKAVLKREPENVEAITHLGVILGIAGHADGALEAFDRALALKPDYAHALWDKARILYEVRQDYAGAIAAWERFVKVGPAGQDREQAMARIREAKARLAGASGAGTAAPGSSKP